MASLRWALPLALALAACSDRPNIDPTPFMMACPPACPAPYTCADFAPESGPDFSGCAVACKSDDDCPDDFSCNPGPSYALDAVTDVSVAPGFCYHASQ